MVYRGKPSAGCDNCRKAKKRCTLEQPACQRCIKLKKPCAGYRDTSALQIHDETVAVTLKAERQKAKTTQTQVQVQTPAPTPRPAAPLAVPSASITNGLLAPATSFYTPAGILTPGSVHSDSTSSSDSTIDLDQDMSDGDSSELAAFNPFSPDTWVNTATLAMSLKPSPDDVATTYFFKQFTSNTHWEFMRGMSIAGQSMDPCLNLAIKACGMAALGNVENVVMGKDYARSMYGEALSLLNEALRDPKRSKTDESLIAVAMLGYFENLTCDGQQSIQSWKAHVAGAAQLLKLRGKAQFQTQTGRILFREMRAQIIISCIWGDQPAPSFFREYQIELTKCSEPFEVGKAIDSLTAICLDFASLRAGIHLNENADPVAAQEASELERRFIQWSIDTTAEDERWRYYELDVADSEHVWDGTVHAFRGLPAPTVWNSWRSMRIMLARTQEFLCEKMRFSDEEREEQMQYFRRTRRQLTNDICATTPASLGHASPAYNSPCVLISAYGSIWPLFFAGTCALERVGPGAWSILKGKPLPAGQMSNKAAAQARWILGRLHYISEHIGLKWADGVAATLAGDFKIDDELLEEDDRALIHKFTKVDRAPWLRKMAETQKELSRYHAELPSHTSDVLANESTEQQILGWLG